MSDGNNHSVLYISYDGMTDPLGQSQVLPYLCGLAERGYRITLLSSEKPDRYQQHKNVIEDICTKAGIHWQPIFYTATPPVLSTIKDVRALQQKARELHRQHNFSIIHCRSYISALVGQSMKKELGTKFLFDMRGFWADERVDGGLWRLSNPLYNIIYKYFKKEEKQYLEQADHIISLTHAGKKEIDSWAHINRNSLPITVIPCCVDTALFNPANITAAQKEACRQALGLQPGQKLIGYVGSIGTWYLLHEMLAYFKVVLQKDSNTKMLFVTTEPAAMILDEAAKMGLPADAFIIRPVARKEVPLYISIMNYSIFFIKPSFSKKASSPTKQGEIMAMGIPVVCNADVGDTEEVVNEYASGVVVNNFDTATLEKAVQEIENKQFDATAIRAGALDFYGLDKGIAAYASVYEQLINK